MSVKLSDNLGYIKLMWQKLRIQIAGPSAYRVSAAIALLDVCITSWVEP